MTAPVPASSVNTEPPAYKYGRSRVNWMIAETLAWVFLGMVVLPVVVWIIVGEIRGVL